MFENYSRGTQAYGDGGGQTEQPRQLALNTKLTFHLFDWIIVQYLRIPYSQTDQSSSVVAQFEKPKLSHAQKLVYLSMNYLFRLPSGSFESEG